MKTNQLTNAAVFAAIASILIIGSALPFGVLLLFLGVPVTMAVLSTRVERGYAYASVSVTMLIIAIVLNPVSAMMSLPFLAMGTFVGASLAKGDTLYFASVQGAVSSFGTLLVLYFSFDILKMSSAAELKAMIELTFFRLLLQNPSLLDVKMIPSFATMIVQLLPSSIIFFHYLFGMICALITARVVKRMGKETNIEPFTKLIMPNTAKNLTIWITFFLFLLFFFVGQNVFVVNATAIMMMMAAVVGIAGLLGLIFSAYPKKFILLPLMVFLHFVLGPLTFYIYAIIDAHYDFRGVRKVLR